MPVKTNHLMNGPNAGQRVILHEELSIGRSSDNGRCLSDQSVSRYHAVIKDEKGKTALFDLGAANGVFVNGRRFDKCGLRAGDEVRLGNTVLRFDEAAWEVDMEGTLGGAIVEPDLSTALFAARL